MEQDVQKLIASARLEEALAILAQNKIDGAINLQARFASAKRDYTLGMLDFSDWSRVQNQITNSALELAKQSPPTAHSVTPPPTYTPPTPTPVAQQPSANTTSGGLQKVKIFLASSSELVDEREQFEIFINRENKSLVTKGVFLELVLWEDALDAISSTRLQDEYNKMIAACDIVVSLFFTKAGKYTQEEFDFALKLFQDTGKPRIFTYFKNGPINTSDLSDDVLSLLSFKKRVKELGHFYTSYDSIGDLKHHFGEQLKKLGYS